MSIGTAADQDIIIMGGTGDLARRKLLPALYNLAAADLLPRKGSIIGYARSQRSDEEFRDLVRAAVQQFSRTGLDEKAWAAFAPRLRFVASEPRGYDDLRLHATLAERLIYLATPASGYPNLVRDLTGHDLVKGTRLIVEKPFGRDLASSRELDETLHAALEESQVYRIDHYLGKETSRTSLCSASATPLSSGSGIETRFDNTQITIAESIGIEGRGTFYEETGALRDIIQNHAFQVLSLLTMEPPASFDSEALGDEKAKVFHAMKPVDPARVVRGQYGRGQIDGEEVPGYRAEEQVAPDSRTETFVALDMAIDNWRWAGVPIYLRAGKRMPQRCVEIQIVFREAPVVFFEGTGVHQLPPNHLSLRLQPDESITFTFIAKAPGPTIEVKPVQMRFSYGESFMTQPAEAYERLLHDALNGRPDPLYALRRRRSGLAGRSARAGCLVAGLHLSGGDMGAGRSERADRAEAVAMSESRWMGRASHGSR